jgi:glucokinase
MKQDEIVAGIDLGGTLTKFGLVNRSGDLLAFGTIPTEKNLHYDDFLKKLAGEIEHLIHSLGEHYILLGICIGAPTGSQFEGTIDNASNLKWPQKLPVAHILKTIFNLPVVVVNDANAAAIGEMLFGAAQGKKNFMVVTLGTGLGCGVVIDGKLLLGAKGHAGELGHIRAIENGRLCGCGRFGCLETYASATGIVRTVLDMAPGKMSESLLGRFDEKLLTAKKITEAALQGDKVALEAFDFTGKVLGIALADAIALLNPELVVLTGGLAKSGDLLLKPTTCYLNKNLLNIYHETVEVKLSEISNKKAAILGLAATIWLQLEELNRVTV